MKQIILLLALTFTIACHTQAQEKIQFTDIDIVNLGDGQQYATKKDADKTPVDGKYRIITGYTTEYVDAEFKGGYAEGTWKYYKNNVLAEEMSYVNGYITGDKITYYPDGQIKIKTPLLKGKVNGTAVRYYPDGKKEYEKGMKDGIDDGPERFYSEDGSVRSETIFKNGRAEGKSFSQINSGMADEYLVTIYYKNGLRHGEHLEVYADGQVKTKGNYIAGKKDGVWEYFRSNGDRAKPTEEYKDDDLIKRTTYYTNGNVEMERGMKNNRQNGPEKKYTPEGKLKSEKNYVDGKQVGKQTVHMTSNVADYTETSHYGTNGKKDGEYTQVYADTGKPKVKGQYANDQKDGKWLYYNQAGKTEKEEIYEKGSLKSTTRFEN